MDPSDPLALLIDRKIAGLIKQSQEVKAVAEVGDMETARLGLHTLADNCLALATTIRTVGE